MSKSMMPKGVEHPKREFIRSILAAALLAAGWPPALLAAPFGCTPSIDNMLADGGQAGAGQCWLDCSARFLCLNGSSGACDFCITFQLEVMDLDTGKWYVYTIPAEDPFTEVCHSVQYEIWTGGAATPPGIYRLTVAFWTLGCNAVLADVKRKQFTITH
jgi:hypothetical protein